MVAKLLKPYFLFCMIILPFMISGVNKHTFKSNPTKPINKDSILTKTDIEEDLDTLISAIEKIHPAPFRTIPKNNWISLKESIIESTPISYSSFYSQLLQLIALAKDGHMDAYSKEMLKIRYSLPAKFIIFPEGLYVVATDPELKPLLGKKIIEIENTPTDLVLKKLSEIVPSDNEWGKQELLEDYVRMPTLLQAVGIKNDQRGIQLTFHDKSNDSNIKTIMPENYTEALQVAPPRRPIPKGWQDARTMENVTLSVWQQNTDKFFWQKSLPELSALYIQINRVLENEEGEFAKFVANLPKPDQKDISKLIIDLRTNRGGDATLIQPLVHYIIKH